MQKIAKIDRRIGTDRQTDKVRYREAPPLKMKSSYFGESVDLFFNQGTQI